MSNKILTFKELETGESYKFLGTTGEYPSNKLVKNSLFSHLTDIAYAGTSSWYLGMGETVTNSAVSSETYHRFDITDQNISHATTHFKIIQEDLTKTGINGTYVWKEHDANLTNVAPYYRHEFYYNLIEDPDGFTTLDKDFPIMADTKLAHSDYDRDNFFNSNYRSNLLGGVTNYALTPVYNNINDHYIVPSCNGDATKAYLNFFDSKSGNGTGYMDIYLGDADGLTLFAQYSYYDYYVKGTYNTTPCVFYCRMRYFGNPTLTPVSNPASIPGDRYNYGTQGSIFSVAALDKIDNTPPIGYIYPAWYETVSGDWVGSFNLEFVPSTDLPYIIDRDGEIYERLKAPSTSLTPSGSLTISGSTLPVYDIRHHFIDGYLSDGYEFNSGGGGGGGNTPDGDLTDQYFKFVNFTTEDIHVYRVWNANNGNNDAPEFIYEGTAFNNAGTLQIQLYQKELDNPDNYGFAFTTADSIYNRNTATIVTITHYAYENGSYDTINGEYVFDEYDVGVSMPGLPLYDEDLFVEQPTMWMSITDIHESDKFSYEGEEKYIGLSHFNGTMYSDLDMQPYDNSGTCNAYLYEEPELYGPYLTISEAPTDGCLSGMGNSITYGYADYFAVSFDQAVELYYRIPGYGYYKIPVNKDGDWVLGGDVHTRIDPMRGAAMSSDGALLCQGVYIDQNLYVKLS